MNRRDFIADAEISRLPAIVADALRYRYTEEERESGRMPPYPIAVALHPHRDRIMRELRSRVEIDGHAPWVVTRMLANQRRLDPRYLDQLGRGFFHFGDAACVLVACAALSIDEAREIIGSLPAFDGDSLRRQIVMTLRDAGELDAARAEADRIGTYTWSAYRDIGWKLAVEGDHEAFFRHWRSYAAGKDRHGMAQLKTTLVRGVAQNQGWAAAVDLSLAEKRLGGGLKVEALGQAAKTMSPDQLNTFLAHDASGLLEEQDELRLLVEALLRAAPRNPTSEHPLLSPIIDRIAAIDPAISKETMRSRDRLLTRLWPAIADVETLNRVRKEVRTPSLKRELTVLPRNVVPASERSQSQQ